MKLYKLFFLIFVTFSSISYSQYTDEVNSNRPGKSMMAFSVGKSIFQTESGLNYVTEKHDLLKYEAKGFAIDFALRWGLFKEQLEVITEIQYQNDSYNQFGITTNRSAVRQTLIGAKYLIYDPFKNGPEKPNLYSWKANKRFKWKQFIPAVAGYAGINLNFSDNNLYTTAVVVDPIVSPKIMAIAQNHFGTKTVLVTNLAYNKIATDFASIDYVLTLTRGINENWSVFIENQGYNGKYYSDGILRTGAAYLHKNNMQFDASVGTNIKDTPALFFGGIGFTWRFTKNYKEIKMDKPNTRSKMDKKMDKKANKNKRKDSVE